MHHSAIKLDEYHLLPGRLRIMIPGMRKNKQLSDYLSGYLKQQSGITDVEANPLTGRVLIKYDAKRLQLNEIQIIIRIGMAKCREVRVCNIKKAAGNTPVRNKLSLCLRAGPLLYTTATGLTLSVLIIKRLLVGRSPLAASRHVCNLGTLIAIVAGYPLLRSGVKVLADRKRINSDLLLFSATLLLLTLRESLTGLTVLWLVYISSLFQFVVQSRSRHAIKKVLRKIPKSQAIDVTSADSRFKARQRQVPQSELYERRLLIGTALISTILLLVTRNIHRSIAVLLAGCPAAIALARNTVQGVAVAASLRRGILVKDARCFEWTAQVDRVVFDQTIPPKDNICMTYNDHDKILLVAGRKTDVSLLTASHLGVALVDQCSPAALVAADVIIKENDLSKLAELIQLGRATERISRQNLFLATGLNLLGVTLASASKLTSSSAGLLLNISTLAVILNSVRLLLPLRVENLQAICAGNQKEEKTCFYP